LGRGGKKGKTRPRFGRISNANEGPKVLTKKKKKNMQCRERTKLRKV